jgi:4-hydroxy-4-methyl-2-oxoglutarate aldolase
MIEDPPLLQARRSFSRPRRDVLARFAGVPTGFLVDCMNGKGALDFQIKPLDRNRSAFVGSALTCHCGPGDNLALLGALAFSERDDAIVIATNDFVGLAVLGDRVAGMARNRGGVALVTDGVVRDTPGLDAVGLPVFCRGVTPNSCMASGPGTIGLPIVVGGVAVASGDVVVGDCDGVVVVPSAEVSRVLDQLEVVRKAETEMDAKVAEGLAVPSRIKEMLESNRIRFLD